MEPLPPGGAKRDRDQMEEDFVAAVRWLQGHDACTGRVACMGFCFGGAMANRMAVRVPDLAAAVPFYGGQPAAEEVERIRAPLLLHFAELDERVNAGWPAYEEALKKAGKEYTAHVYAGANHGSTTTPRHGTTRRRPSWRGRGPWDSWAGT